MDLQNKLLYAFIALVFIILILYKIRRIQVNKALIELNDRLLLSKYKYGFFDNEILPVIMKMTNPFTFKKATIENYFPKEFQEKYLIPKQ